MAWIWPIYSLQMDLKDWFRVFPVYGRLRIMDLVTWHGNPAYFFIFWEQNLMYTGYNGATYVYASCLTVACVYVQKIEFFILEGETWVYRGKGKAIKARCMECWKNCYNKCPLMCEVIGTIVMVEIHSNSQKWSSEDLTWKLVTHENIIIHIDSVHMVVKLDYNANPCG